MLNNPDPVDIYVANQIRVRRVACAMTQADLAHALGISTQMLQKYESARSRVPPAKLVKMSAALEVDVEYFFEGFPGYATAGDAVKAPHRFNDEVAQLVADYYGVSDDEKVALRLLAKVMAGRK